MKPACDAHIQALPFAAGVLGGAFATTCSAASATFVAIGAAALSVLIFLLGSGLRRQAVLFVIGAAATALSVVVQRPVALPPEFFNGDERTFAATVVSAEDTPGSRQIIAVGRVDGVERPLRLRMVVPDVSSELEVGHEFTASAAFELPGRLEQVPGLATQELGQRAGRVSAFAIVPSERITVTGRKGGIGAWFHDLRGKMELAVYDSGLSASTASLLASSLLGARDAVPHVKEQFRATGLSHLLCVSGFHVAVLCSVILLVLCPLRLMSRGLVLQNVLLLVAVWFYAALTGLAPSVLRAAIMVSCFIVARLLQREASAFNSLAVAVGVMLIVNPWWLYAPGFQLSVCAVAGLLVFAGPLNPVPVKYLALRRLTDVFTIPVAATIATAPVLLALFHRLPLLSMPVNAFASLLFPLFMFVGAVHVLLSAMGVHIVLLAGALEWTADTISRLCSLFEGYELNGIYLTPAALIALVAAIVLLAIFVRLRSRLHKTLAAAAMSIMAVTTACVNTPPSPAEAVLDLHPYGQSVYIARGSRGMVYTTRNADHALDTYRRYFAAHGISPDRITVHPMPSDGRIPHLPPIPPGLIHPRPLIYAYPPED